MPTDDPRRKLYRARRPDGEVAWVDHDELWQIQHSRAEELRRSRARRRRVAAVALCGLLALVVAAVVYRLRSPADAPAPPPAAVEPDATPPAARADSGPLAVAAGSDESAAGPPVTAPSAPAATADGPPPPTPAPAEQVEGAVRAWADAWARQDVAAYLASYAAEFEPPDGLPRPEWVSLRRRRVRDRASIELKIEALEIELRGAGRAEARFRQSYSSPSYSDVVRKTLVLVEDEGDWRIVAERASAP